jgi:DNA-binding NarL/FixJ family response regulator
MLPAVRLLIIDDHQVFSASLSRLLADDPAIDGVETVTGVRTLAAALSRTQPDLAVVDWLLDDGDGTEAIRVIRRLSPSTRILVLTGERDDEPLRRAVAAGCDGFVTKDRPPEDVLAAIRAVGNGQVHFEPAALARIVQAEPAPEAPGLTDREREIVTLLAAGRTNKELATELFLSPNTIRNHLHRIGRKLDAGSRLDIVIRAVQLGLVEIDDVG